MSGYSHAKPNGSLTFSEVSPYIQTLIPSAMMQAISSIPPAFCLIWWRRPSRVLSSPGRMTKPFQKAPFCRTGRITFPRLRSPIGHRHLPPPNEGLCEKRAPPRSSKEQVLMIPRRCRNGNDLLPLVLLHFFSFRDLTRVGHIRPVLVSLYSALLGIA